MSASPRDDHDDLFDDDPAPNGADEAAVGDAPQTHNDEETTAGAEEQGDLMDDLFGDDDEDNAPPPKRSRSASSAPTTPDNRQSGAQTRSRSRSRTRTPSGTPRDPLEYAEEDDQQPEPNEATMSLMIPPVQRLESADDKIWHLKLPSFVAVDPAPYNSDTQRDEKAAADKARAEAAESKLVDGNASGLGLGSATAAQQEDDDKKAAAASFLLAKNTIRWKWVSGPDGVPVRKSNARFVRWSDGSFSLQLGSDLFDVSTTLHPSTAAAAANGSSDASTTTPTEAFPTFKPNVDPKSLPRTKTRTGLTATASAANMRNTSDNPDNVPVVYLCQSTTDNIFLMQTPLAGNLSLLPTSMASKTHMELVSHIDRQHARQSKLKMLDSEQDRELMMRSEVGAEIKARMKARPVQRTGSGGIGGGGGGGAGNFGRRGASKKKASYSDDDSDDYNANNYGGGGRKARPRGSRAGAGRPIGVDAGEYDEDDGFVVADSESEGSAAESGSGGDSDEYGGGGAKSKKSKKSKSKGRKRDSGSASPLEDADRLIEEQMSREKKRRRKERKEGKREKRKSAREFSSDSEPEAAKGGADGGEEDMDMDMDIEEED